MITKTNKKTVSILITTKIKGQIKFILQKRGAFNHEINKKESYAGAYQITCHGGVEPGESFKQALVREASEEVGPVFARQLKMSTNKLAILYKNKNKMTYGLFLKYTPRLKKSLPKNFILITKEDILKTKSLTIKDRAGVKRGQTKMFPDEIELLK